MEIPKRIRDEADYFYEASDNQDYVISMVSGSYIPKHGSVFEIRHYHHIDRDRSNNAIWNLAPLSYEEHVILIHSKNDAETQRKLYENMYERFPEHEEHYRKYLIEKVERGEFKSVKYKK